MITAKEIKQKLGYSPINKKVDYLIKRDGVLDEIGYTETISDFPVSWELTQYNSPVFTPISEYKNAYPEMFKKNDISYIVINPNFKVKKPVKAFYRTRESIDNNIVDGTFYEPFNTHAITYDVFDFFMNNDKLGAVGFYIYGYLKYKCETCGGSYSSPLTRLENELKLSHMTILKYTSVLENEKYLDIDHKDYVVGFKKGESGREAVPNIYKIII
jgi:hypothetical protein